MTDRTTPDDPTARHLERGLIAVAVLAPLPFGGVVPGGRLAIEIAAFVLLALRVVAGRGRDLPRPTRAQTAGIVLLVALAVLQTLPLGDAVVERLAPRPLPQTPAAVLAAERAALEVERLPPIEPRTLSFDPAATASALRSGAAYAALFVVALAVVATRGAGRLARALLVSAAAQSLYGIVVLASGTDRIWHVAKRAYLDAATGTFVNKNHFAGYLTVALAIGAGWWIGERLRVGWRAGGSRALWFGLMLALGCAGLLLSLSRAGIVVGLAALGWIAWRAARVDGRRHVPLAVAAAVAIGAVAFVPLGSERLVERYAESDELVSVDGGRLRVWSDTVAMATALPWTGSGFGTFAGAYPMFRSPEVRLRYTHAHNDWLQWWAEGGLVGALGLALLLIPLARAAIPAAGGRHGFTVCGAAAAVVAASLHATIDFNLHIPANAALIAIAAGIVQGGRWRRA